MVSQIVSQLIQVRGSNTQKRHRSVTNTYMFKEGVDSWCCLLQGTDWGELDYLFVDMYVYHCFDNHNHRASLP